ncbi:MAG: HD-GYP domain-containing protein [Schwartzia sp.]|nr:HD-GYP domain-containing protein [Schwartzia sp. (in: firmicutes)]
MINLPIKKLRPGMITAQSIYNKKGGSYLTRGTPVTEQYISRLKKLGVTNITVTSVNPAFSVLPPDDIIQEKTRVKAIHKVYDTYHALESTGELSADALEGTSEDILVDILSNRSNLVQLTDLRMHDDYTFAHSVNVAVLAGMLGAQARLSKQDMLNLIMGSLLHDIGKIFVPSDILTKPGRLSDSEFTVIQMHPEAGRKKLRDLNMPAASVLAAIASQHHEHMDGRGYPHHLMGDKIHRFARIVAVADVYDALTTRRSYKPAYKPHIAYKIMTKCSPGQFDEPLLSLFFDNVAIYPVGTVLKTTMGYAIVKKCEFGHTLTPTICVFGDINMNVLPHPFDIDLRKCPPDTISSVLEDMEIMPLMFRMQIDPAQFLQEEA